MTDRPTLALQENMLAMLCYSDNAGRVISQLVEPELFEGDYRRIADRAVQFWKKNNAAPKVHTADLIADILEDKANRRAPMLRRLIADLADLAQHCNEQHVIHTASQFVRVQRFKQTILLAGQRINAQEDMALDEVEGFFAELLRTREINFSAGMRLSDSERVLEALEQRDTEFSMGIPLLNRRHIVPARGTVVFLLAPKGTGKSWFLTNVGKANLRNRKVLHIPLEMDAPLCTQRYYQALFSVPKREYDVYSHSKFVFEYDGDKPILVGFEDEDYVPDFTLRDPNVRDELTTRLNTLGMRIDNLVIKDFPTGQLTFNQLVTYLDNLERVEHFVPDLLIIDYPKLMKIDMRDYRLSLGRTVEDIRGLCRERNMAGVFVHQVGREGKKAKMARTHHVAEDWSIIHTADIAMTFSKTDAEKRLGLGRLFVENAREETDAWGVLLSQDYTIGQFALDATYLPDDYFDVLKETTGMITEGEDEEDEPPKAFVDR